MALRIRSIYQGKQFRDAKECIWAFYRDIEVGARKRITPLIKQALLSYLKRTAVIVATRNSRPYPGGTSASSLGRRSGTAFQSIHDSVRVTGGAQNLNTLKGYIGGVGYLATHEFGAVIRPRNGQYLTVPLPAALNADGTPKRRSARMWNDTFVARSRAGNLLIFQKDGARIIPLYVLKTEVRIPPRLGMSLTLDNGAFKFIEECLRLVRAEFGQL